MEECVCAHDTHGTPVMYYIHYYVHGFWVGGRGGRVFGIVILCVRAPKKSGPNRNSCSHAETRLTVTFGKQRNGANRLVVRESQSVRAYICNICVYYDSVFVVRRTLYYIVVLAGAVYMRRYVCAMGRQTVWGRIRDRQT